MPETEEPNIPPPERQSPGDSIASHLLTSQRFDGIALTLGAIALLALAFSVQSILSPFVIVLIFYVLLAPFRQYRAARKLMLAGFVLFTVWFFITLSGLLVPFILGAVLAYLFNPLVARLHDGGHLHRTWSSLIIVLLFCAVLTIVGWIFLPSLVDQTKEFISRLTIFARANSDVIDPKYIRKVLVSVGLPPAMADDIVKTQVGPQLRKIVGYVPHLFMDIVGGLPKFFERTLSIIIIPVAMFYFLKDWSKIGPLFNEIFPAKNPAHRAAMMDNVDRVLYGYIRGQATVAVLVGVLAAIAYSILGIPYAGLLGLTLGLFDLIPIVGMVLSAFIVELVIVLTMVLNFGVIISGLLVIGCLHILEIYVISPRIIGQNIGIPPLVMILALLIFGYFLGFIGLLIAVPVTGILLLFVDEYRKNNALPTE